MILFTERTTCMNIGEPLCISKQYDDKLYKSFSRYQQPCYVLDIKKFKENLIRYKGHDNFMTLFSVKICPIPKILNMASTYVKGYDIANHKEFELLKNIDLKNKTISICGTAYDHNDVQKILKRQIKKLIMVVDNVPQYLKLKPFLKRKNVYFMTRISETMIDKKYISHYGLTYGCVGRKEKFLGYHIHISRTSGLRSVKNYFKFYKSCIKDTHCTTINFGGAQHYYDWFTLKSKLDKKIDYIIEPGQPFFIDSFYAVGNIISFKQNQKYKILISDLSDLCHMQWSRYKSFYTKHSGSNMIKIYGPTCCSEDIHGIIKGNFAKILRTKKVIFSNVNPCSFGLQSTFNGQKKIKVEYHNAQY